MTELDDFSRRIRDAASPEDVFGALAGDQLAAARKIYRRLARIAHADHYVTEREKQLAHEAFVKLSALWTQCQARIQSGFYGTNQTSAPLGTVLSSAHAYTLEALHQRGELSNVYQAVDENNQPRLVKVALARSVNDLLKAEAHTLQYLAKKLHDASVSNFIPALQESFQVSVDNAIHLHVNVFDYATTFRSLTEVMAEYPNGVNSRHFVWIYKRLLSLLGAVHDAHCIHGAVLPTHVLVEPATHAILLVDWCFAVKPDHAACAMSNAYRSWYPPEVIARKKLTPATDLYMAARCMTYALGGDNGDIPRHVPERFRRVLAPCLLGNPAYRSQDAWELYNELDVAARVVYGNAQYEPLVMPALEA